MARYEDLNVEKLRLQKLGIGGVEPGEQSSKISDPSGGATVDAEARTAINAIIDALENVGISSPT